MEWWSASHANIRWSAKHHVPQRRLIIGITGGHSRCILEVDVVTYLGNLYAEVKRQSHELSDLDKAKIYGLIDVISTLAGGSIRLRATMLDWPPCEFYDS